MLGSIRDHYSNLPRKAIELLGGPLDAAFGANTARVNPVGRPNPDPEYTPEIKAALIDIRNHSGGVTSTRHLSMTIADHLLTNIMRTLEASFARVKDVCAEAVRAAETAEMPIGGEVFAAQSELPTETEITHTLTTLYGKCARTLRDLRPALHRSVLAAIRADMLRADAQGRNPFYIAADVGDNTVPQAQPGARARPETAPSSIYVEPYKQIVRNAVDRKRNYVRYRVILDGLYTLLPSQVCALVALGYHSAQALGREWTIGLGIPTTLVTLGASPISNYVRARRVYDRKMLHPQAHEALCDPETSVGKARKVLQDRHGRNWRVAFEGWASRHDAMPLATALQIARAVRLKLQRALSIDKAGEQFGIDERTLIGEDLALHKEAEAEGLRQAEAIFRNEETLIQGYLRATLRLSPDLFENDRPGIRALSALHTNTLDPHVQTYYRFLQKHPRVQSEADVDERADNILREQFLINTGPSTLERARRNVERRLQARQRAIP